MMAIAKAIMEKKNQNGSDSRIGKILILNYILNKSNVNKRVSGTILRLLFKKEDLISTKSKCEVRIILLISLDSLGFLV